MSNENGIALARANGRVLRLFTSSGGGGTTYTAGDGISISQENVISANVDGETIVVNSSGHLESLIPKVAVTGTLDSTTYEYTVDLQFRQYSLIEVPSNASTLTINIPAASTGELDEASFKVIPQGSSISQVNFIQDGYLLPVISNVPSGTMLSNQMYYQGTVVDGVVTFSEVNKPTPV